jgi:hypothetical protein|tara:strand:+ start:82 stop:264 length:183 start_codon:yes stop_codon:yes gene_type:complete
MIDNEDNEINNKIYAAYKLATQGSSVDQQRSEIEEKIKGLQSDLETLNKITPTEAEESSD